MARTTAKTKDVKVSTVKTKDVEPEYDHVDTRTDAELAKAQKTHKAK